MWQTALIKHMFLMQSSSVKLPSCLTDVWNQKTYVHSVVLGYESDKAQPITIIFILRWQSNHVFHFPLKFSSFICSYLFITICESNYSWQLRRRQWYCNILKGTEHSMWWTAYVRFEIYIWNTWFSTGSECLRKISREIIALKQQVNRLQRLRTPAQQITYVCKAWTRWRNW